VIGLIGCTELNDPLNYSLVDCSGSREFGMYCHPAAALASKIGSSERLAKSASMTVALEVALLAMALMVIYWAAGMLDALS
jgi:hypothetical protein